MKVTLTEYAFDRYSAGSHAKGIDYCSLQEYLDKEAGEELHFLEWKGKQVVYMHQAYWCYELDAVKQEMTLTTCLGVMEFRSFSNSGNQESVWNRRYATTFVN